MKSNEKLWAICEEIYRELFKMAEPSGNFGKMVESGESKQRQFFMKYYLSEDKQQEIMDRIMKTHKLSKLEKRAINKTVHLGCSPNTCKETWQELKST